MIRKQILWEDVKRHQEETQDCQRSTCSILDPRNSEQPSDITKKFKVADFRDVSVTMNAPHRHSSSLDILSSSDSQESKQSEANMVVTKIATTSTVTSSHTTLSSVTSIGTQKYEQSYFVEIQNDT